jgi:hypothetical protein
MRCNPCKARHGNAHAHAATSARAHTRSAAAPSSPTVSRRTTHKHDRWQCSTYAHTNTQTHTHTRRTTVAKRPPTSGHCFRAEWHLCDKRGSSCGECAGGSAGGEVDVRIATPMLCTAQGYAAYMVDRAPRSPLAEHAIYMHARTRARGRTHTKTCACAHTRNVQHYRPSSYTHALTHPTLSRSH